MKTTFYFIVLLILILLVFTDSSKAQTEDKIELFQRFLKQYESGDIVNSENTLLLLLKMKGMLTMDQLKAVYNNLGATNTLLGKYKDALDFYNIAANIESEKKINSVVLADIYINKAIIFEIQKSYPVAIEFYDKGIRIYLNIHKPDHDVLYRLSAAYLNLGILYSGIGEYTTALEYLFKSSDLKQKYSLKEISLVYSNIAKAFMSLNHIKEAEQYFKKSIESFTREFGKDYYRSAEVYFQYGLFLRSEGKITEALDVHKRALSICLKNYGAKNTLVSLSYKYIADDFNELKLIDSALYYYQRSLIAVSENFNNSDIYTNPSIDSSLFDIRLLDNLKRKAQALQQYATKQNNNVTRLSIMSKSLETIELAIQLINRIRKKFLSDESRIYLAENEKETYLFATQVAYDLYALKSDVKITYKMYSIAQQAKAAILQADLTGNELLYSRGIPDSLREERNKLTGNISAYNKLILEENRNVNPDNKKIEFWKDALFEMNREKERVTAEIEQVFPEYRVLINRTQPDPLQKIQEKMQKNETIIDYLLSNQYSEGKRKLFVFLISKDSLSFAEEFLDSLFVRNAEIIHKTAGSSLNQGSGGNNFESYTGALNYMYNYLIRPFEKKITGKRLIIIPDEEIAWLSFDAFLKNLPQPGQTDYEGLNYLIKDYVFSYGYSSSLLFSKNKSNSVTNQVFAFSPDYTNTKIADKPISTLQGTATEIESIFKWFRGKEYSGPNASRTNFISALKDSAIFHLAMHSMTDSMNSKYSYLMFDTPQMLSDDGKLYNYEISLAKINSPMVVLSACNSGTGKLYYGEGVMSLARGFILAGASSVIKTAWEINDETSTKIITRFYYHLSKGKEKDVAMRQSKLDYLKNSSPVFTNPYYWAAYEVLGDTRPVTQNKTLPIVVLAFWVIVVCGIALIYFRRRNIFSERSW